MARTGAANDPRTGRPRCGNPDRQAEMIYKLEKQQVNGLSGQGLVDLLGGNQKMKNELRERGNTALTKQAMFQAFATAGRLFHVIPNETRGVLVPYKDGINLAEKLRGCRDFPEMKKLLKQAQRFSVNLYRHQLLALTDEGVLEELGVSGVLYLHPQWYDEQSGALISRRRSVDDYIQ